MANVDQETEVRVRLVLDRAEADLREFNRKAKSVAKRVGSTIRKTVGRGLGAVGLGAGVGVGLAAVRGATQSGLADAVGESLHSVGAQLAEFFLGDIDEKARGARAAREDVIAAFAYQAGNTGVTPGMLQFFDATHQIHMQVERGRQVINQHPLMSGPKLDEVLGRIIEGLGKAIEMGFQKLKEALGL